MRAVSVEDLGRVNYSAPGEEVETTWEAQQEEHDLSNEEDQACSVYRMCCDGAERVRNRLIRAVNGGAAPICRAHGVEWCVECQRSIWADHRGTMPVLRARTDKMLATRAFIPGVLHEGVSYPPLDARHLIDQHGDDVEVAEEWYEGDAVVQRYAVRLTLPSLVHLVLNTTQEERESIGERADWRGVDGDGHQHSRTTAEDVPAAHKMDAAEGPLCACGKPSVHESGWCGECDADACLQCGEYHFASSPC